MKAFLFERSLDRRYSYIYTESLGKQRTIYADSLVALRKKEESQIIYICGITSVYQMLKEELERQEEEGAKRLPTMKSLDK